MRRLATKLLLTLLPRTLEAKARWTFLGAIILIMGLALLWPWYRMEALVDEQNLRVAREAARLELLRFHAGPDAYEPLSPDGVYSESYRVEVLGVGTRPPRWVLGDDLADPEGRGLPRFERRSLEYLRSHPGENDTNHIARTDDGGKVYRYFVLLRNTGGCLTCHGSAAAGAEPPAAAVAGIVRPSSGGSSVLLPPKPAGSPAPAALPPGAANGGVAGAANGGAAGGAVPAAPSPPPPAEKRTRPIRRFAPDESMGAISITIPLPRNDWGLAVNRAVIVLAGLLGVLCAMVVFYRIAHSLFLGPVASLQAVAVKAGQGDLSARADVRTGDEFQHFSETFNRMLESLAAGRQQLQEANRSLDIKLGELAQVNVALHEANKLKSEFLANVSHELRTPLNSIIGFADLLKDTAEGERPRRYVANILTSARGLLELINDLLDLAKIEAGRMDVRLEMLSTVDLCETLAGLMKPLADQKRLTVEIAAEPDLPLIRTDPSKVRQIIYNFLSNAIKFTPPEGRVTLGVRRVDAGFVALSVSDTGPGVAKEFQQVIFEKFRQLDGSVTREHQGTGLGLAISKELASLLGGGIRLESEPGQGATFTLTLPLDAAAAGVNPSVRLHASLVAG